MAQEKKPSAFMKPVNLSKELEIIVGKGPMPRPEVTKKLWEYIKKNKLQDTQNKRNINPDSNLAKVVGQSNAINMFDMAKQVSKHLTA